MHESHDQIIRRITSAYSGVIRAYSTLRFSIIHVRFLEEIEQYLPARGTVLDLGCGFGLFALYMATCRPDIRLVGLDLNPRRIDIARATAAKLGIANCSFMQQDLCDWSPSEPVAGAYVLDVLHHLPPETADRLIAGIHARLDPGGRFIVKDVDTHPAPMRWFCRLTDLVMAPRDRVTYRSAAAWTDTLQRAGFGPVHVHHMRDYLPYPHTLHIAHKPPNA
jgi:cyclopropane fatty-acyl-phospholipid synthase-like methyltransferase